MSSLKRYPFHPLLAAAYPVLALLAYNIAQVKPSDALRPLLITLAGAAVLWLALRLLLRDGERSSVLATTLLALFFSYGHVYNYFEQQAVFGLILGRHRLLMPVWLMLALLALGWVLKGLRDPRGITNTLNVITAVAVAMPLGQLLIFGIRTLPVFVKAPQEASENTRLRLPEGQTPPDIYWIILDAYTRSDILQREFGFDNTPFLNSLQQMGFYVAECGQSNYAQTELSLTTALNLDYLKPLGVPAVPGSIDHSALWPLFRHSVTRQTLERLGYKIVAFDSGYYRTQLDDAAIYLSRRTGGVNGFEVMLVKTTAGLVFTDAALILPKFLNANVDDLKRQELRATIQYELETLPKLPEDIQGPKFVFVHVLGPHEPFVFGPNGESVFYPDQVDEKTYREGYRDELEYLNSQLILILRGIIENSTTPPVVIIQGDHGAGITSDRGRMSILNAYYLPNEGGRALYPSITPVNTFRVVFNAYFGGQFVMLPDVSYYSVYTDPYNFRVIPPVEGCGGK